MSLIPEIEIGKKYLVRSQLIELLCPSCGVNLGLTESRRDVEVTVVSSAEEYLNNYCFSRLVACQDCKHTFSLSLEGWYAVRSSMTGRVNPVPYTQLEEIEEEEYGNRELSPRKI